MSRRRRGLGPRISPLSTVELSSRRVNWRRRRARRRAGLAIAVLLLCAGVPALALSRGHHHRRPRPSPLATTAGPLEPPIAPPLGASPPASSHSPRTDPYRAVDHVLRYTQYVRVGEGRRRDVALTFDDGPGPYTSTILSILRRTHTPATFFAIGREVSLYPRLIAEEARDGFEIGDHTETHPFLAALSASVQETQLTEAAQAIRRAGAPYPRLFRPPYGSFDPATLEVLRSERMLMVLWTVDTSDYARPGVARIVYVALSGARPGAIILMHDGGGNRAETAEALPRIIAVLRRKGYRLVTVSQLVADDPPPHGQPVPRSLSGTG